MHDTFGRHAIDDGRHPPASEFLHAWTCRRGRITFCKAAGRLAAFFREGLLPSWCPPPTNLTSYLDALFACPAILVLCQCCHSAGHFVARLAAAEAALCRRLCVCWWERECLLRMQRPLLACTKLWCLITVLYVNVDDALSISGARAREGGPSIKASGLPCAGGFLPRFPAATLPRPQAGRPPAFVVVPNVHCSDSVGPRRPQPAGTRSVLARDRSCTAGRPAVRESGQPCLDPPQ